MLSHVDLGEVEYYDIIVLLAANVKNLTLFETAFVHHLVAGWEQVKEADGRLEALAGVEGQVLRLRSAWS